MQYFYALIVLLYISSEISAVPLSNSKSEVTSRVHIRHMSRRKRSVESGHGLGDYIELEMDAFDTTHRLQLRSPKPTFTEGFEYHEVGVDSNGKVIRTERTPSKREIQAIEKNIYVDHEAHAVLRVEDVDGELHMGGIVGNIRISRDEATNEHIATDNLGSMDSNQTDYIDPERPVATPRGAGGGKISVSPEVCFVIEHEIAKLFNFDQAKLLDYVGVMLNAVNNRYATLSDPQVVFKVSGIYVMKSTAAQPYFESSKNAQGKIDLTKLLASYSQWVMTEIKDVKNHDLTPLLYGVEPQDNIVGLAWLNGACGYGRGVEGSWACSVSHDAGGSWKGAITLAHELAHNMGAPHDGIEAKAKSCSWESGYIMSYKGYGTLNKFTFSPCSASLMKEFIQTTGGHCLFKADTANPPPPVKGDIGDRITMEEMCKKRFPDPKAIPKETDPNLQCLELVCKVVVETPNGSGGTRISTNWKSFGELPGDNSPCGQGGKCKNGKCVVSG